MQKGLPKGCQNRYQNRMKNGPNLRRPSGSVFGPPEGQNGGLVYTRAPFSRFAQSRFLSILVYFWYQKGTLKSIKNLIKNRAHSETSFFEILVNFRSQKVAKKSTKILGEKRSKKRSIYKSATGRWPLDPDRFPPKPPQRPYRGIGYTLQPNAPLLTKVKRFP